MAAPEKDPLTQLKAIGAQIRRLRERRGMSQQELGEKTQPPGKDGIHYNTIGDYERGDGGGFSILTAIAMAEALDVPLDQLVGRRGTPQEVDLARKEDEYFVRQRVIDDLKEALRTGEWDEAKKHFLVGFGWGYVLKPDALKVPEDQHKKKVSEVAELLAKAGREAKKAQKRWIAEEVDRDARRDPDPKR